MSKHTKKEYAEAALECLRHDAWNRSLAKQIRAYIAELEAARATADRDSVIEEAFERAPHCRNTCNFYNFRRPCGCPAPSDQADERRTSTAERDSADAARYRWLREQHWNEADMAVVCNPKESVRLGFDCPSGQRLDAAIDAAIESQRSGDGS